MAGIVMVTDMSVDKRTRRVEWFIESGACPVKCTIVPSKTISPGLRFDKRSCLRVLRALVVQ
jgi:hypothetical protein